MSLARIALRRSAIEALRGKTLVGDNVLDSQIGALESGPDGAIRTDQETPFISVYVEGGLNEKPGRSGALHQPGDTDLLFEYGITAAMTELDEQTGESKVVTEIDPQTGALRPISGVPATDGAFELFLDIVGRQIINALTDPDNEWSQIFRDLSSETTKIVRRRTSDAATGTRIAAHQLVITVKLVPEPLRGVPRAAACPYRRFIEKLEALPDGAGTKTASALRALIETGDTATDYATWRRMLGLSKGGAELLGKGEGVWPSTMTTVIDGPYAPEAPRE